jgi:hypothetical protein
LYCIGLWIHFNTAYDSVSQLKEWCTDYLMSQVDYQYFWTHDWLRDWPSSY